MKSSAKGTVGIDTIYNELQNQSQKQKRRRKKMKVKISKDEMEKLKKVRQLRKELEKTDSNLMKTVQENIKKDILKAQIQSMKEEQTQKKK